MSRLLVLAGLVATLGACRIRYSAEVDCRETLACCDELNDPADFSLQECISGTEAEVAGFDETMLDTLDERFRACGDLTGCAYDTCFTGQVAAACPLTVITEP